MARFKPYDYSQGRMVPVNLEEQIEPGTFVYALHHLIEARYDDTFLAEEYGGTPSIITYDASVADLLPVFSAADLDAIDDDEETAVFRAAEKSSSVTTTSGMAAKKHFIMFSLNKICPSSISPKISLFTASRMENAASMSSSSM